jgi:hypothetical protein
MAAEVKDAVAGPQKAHPSVDFVEFVHRASGEALFLCPLEVMVLRLPSSHGFPARLVAQGTCNIEEKAL